jgi:hypothetical protein
MYRVEYYCPLEAPYWQAYRENPWWIFANACKKVDELMWQYHSARVVDSSGNVLYQQ